MRIFLTGANRLIGGAVAAAKASGGARYIGRGMNRWSSAHIATELLGWTPRRRSITQWIAEELM